jgi:uncharacterized protein
MTPEERQLITGLFDRMRGFPLTEKDAEAEALINERMATLRDAPYMLVQSVLIQEHALQQADARIKELEEQVRALESAPQQRPSGSGSFLGGLFGSSRPAEPERGPSVPAVGARATPSVYDNRPASPAWSAQQPPGQPPGGPFAQGAQPGGGGFLRSAMSTAAGVAGGVLAAGAISNLLGGHSAHATPAANQSTQDPAASSAKDTAQQPQDAATSKDDAYQDGYQDAASKDDDYQDAMDDSDGDWGGGDDLDI